MGSKRRFGISIESNLAYALDELASKLGVDRSKLIEKAIRNFLLDHIHYLIPHECRGMMVLAGKYEKKLLLSIIEEYRDVIHSYIHTHINDACIEIIIVSGHSSRISALHSALERDLKGCSVRYIPVRYELGKTYNKNLLK